jgi:hypothetical protein
VVFIFGLWLRKISNVLGIIAIIAAIVYLCSCGLPRVPRNSCVKDHTEMQIVALPGGASVGGINVGGGIEMASISVCDTIARFDTLGHEMPGTRRKSR